MEEKTNSGNDRRPKKNYKTNEQVLFDSETIFINLKSHPLIKATLAEYGYTDEKVAEGETIYLFARNTYNGLRKEEAEKTVARKNLNRKAEEFSTVYNRQRKSAKIIFRRDPMVIKQLAIEGELPGTLSSRLEEARNYYRVIKADTSLAEKLLPMKITPEEIVRGETLASDTEKARATYLVEKGEKEDATAQKNAAFRNNDYWISELKAVASIAFEDNPQLLEALTKRVKS